MWLLTLMFLSFVDLPPKKISNKNLQIVILELPRLEEGPNDRGPVWFSSCICAHTV
jgi:hypothetical protein